MSFWTDFFDETEKYIQNVPSKNEKQPDMVSSVVTSTDISEAKKGRITIKMPVNIRNEPVRKPIRS